MTVGSRVLIAQCIATVSVPIPTLRMRLRLSSPNITECTYDQPSNRRRNPPPQYIETLENRVQRAEALLRCFLPDVDLTESNFDNILQSGPATLNLPPRVTTQPAAQPTDARPDVSDVGRQSGTPDSELESMVRTTGLLDLDEQGHWDYTGNSSGRSFLRSLRERFGVMTDPNEVGTVVPSGPTSRQSYSVESPKTSQLNSPMQSNSPAAELPSREVALELCDHGLDDAMLILPCVHQPSFYRSLHRLYDRPHELYTDEDHKFLPLLYVVIALGRLFARNDESDAERSGYKSAMDEA